MKKLRFLSSLSYYYWHCPNNHFFGSRDGPASDKIAMILRAPSQIVNKTENVERKQQISVGGAVRKEIKSCRVSMTVLLFFEEKTEDARACT